MKLHRLIMANYRGVAHREIEFPDHGVIVIHGANEIGKSSMIEALDLLLEARDRSVKKEVKQVKPANADVGAEVTAEISTGPYRFVYRKRFHKKCETELTVLEPRREQLTGDEAHERVRAMLAETVDTGLWRAQRVLQAASTEAVELSGSDALSRALDVAAHSADVASLSGTEPLLIERIDAEYARYFTATGRRTGDWSDAISRLDTAKTAVAECTSAMTEVDDRVQRHAEVTKEVAELSRQCSEASPRLDAAQAAANRADELVRALREAKLVAAAAVATSVTASGAHSDRLALIVEINSCTEVVTTVAAELRDAVDQQEAADTEFREHEAAVEEARRTLAAAHQRAESAQCALDRISDRAEAERLRARIAKIDEVQGELDGIGRQLSAVVLTEEALRRIEGAAANVDRVGDQLASISAVVEFTAVADIELAVEGQRVSLPAGQSWSMTATGPTDVDIVGLLTARVSPGATVLDIHAKYDAAQHELADALAVAGVADIAAARLADQRRRELAADRDRLSATLIGLCGEDQIEQLRVRLAELRPDQPEDAEPVPTDITAARTERDAADTARVTAQAGCEAMRQSADSAARRLAEANTRAAGLRNEEAARRAELDAAVTRLAQERASVADEALKTAAEAKLREAKAAELSVADLEQALAAVAPDAIAAELAEASEVAGALRHRHVEAVETLKNLSIELAVLRSEGRKGKLDAARTEFEHAAAQHERIGTRARAAQLLRSVMARHRDTARRRYAEPFRAELQRLGRPVFGPTFEVDVDSELQILSRTLDGTTVPYESLSGGAKEQLGILARLAGAALVAQEDTVPVVVDDALGFTDPGRLAAMSEVFGRVGDCAQVIVLTCSPTRYDGVAGAHRIDLGS
ncbi:AAA family ATPase [Mycobacterium sp.]|uniref:AAA family ATPase n=1 Tax=Mycobacterium sp. TaxID=1785 RepID=UPI003A89C753